MNKSLPIAIGIIIYMVLSSATLDFANTLAADIINNGVTPAELWIYSMSVFVSSVALFYGITRKGAINGMSRLGVIEITVIVLMFFGAMGATTLALITSMLSLLLIPYGLITKSR